MAGILRIGLTNEGDGTGELVVSFEAQGFSGHSRAWFDLATIAADIEKFAAFPLASDSLPVVRGGYWNRDGTCIDQEHVHLSAKPLGGTGDVVLLVKLSMPSEFQDCQELSFSASAALKVSYEQLAKLVSDLRLLLSGAIEEVVFYEQT